MVKEGPWATDGLVPVAPRILAQWKEFGPLLLGLLMKESGGVGSRTGASLVPI